MYCPDIHYLPRGVPRSLFKSLFYHSFRMRETVCRQIITHLGRPVTERSRRLDAAATIARQRRESRKRKRVKSFSMHPLLPPSLRPITQSLETMSVIPNNECAQEFYRSGTGFTKLLSGLDQDLLPVSTTPKAVCGIFLIASKTGELLRSYQEYAAKSVGKQGEEFLIAALVKS
jgi:hypothetical protein